MWVRSALTALVCCGALVLTAAPATADALPDDLLPPLPELLKPSKPSGKRPAVTAEPQRPANRTTAPGALVSPMFVSATYPLGHRPAPIVVPDAALPWRFWVDRALADRFGEQVVVNAVRQWDGIAGSRWATRYEGLVDNGSDDPDGRSVVFLKSDCPSGTGGWAYWQTATGQADARYGDAAAYVSEVDIAVCSGVTTPSVLRQVVSHEVGHAMGLAHLCDPGQSCWQEGMGAGPHACRLMYASSTSCRSLVTAAEHNAAVHLYPRLRRLSGPTRIETAARASYAAFPARSAPVVIVAEAGGTAHGPLAAAALAGLLEAPFLLAHPDMEDCLTGAAAEELARVAADPGRVVLVGDWPDHCVAALGDWGLQVDRSAAPHPVGLALAVADLMEAGGRMGDTAVLVSARAAEAGHVPDGVAGGAAAAALRGPVLFTDPERLSPATAAWMRDRDRIQRVYVLGGEAALASQVTQDLAGLGVAVHRVAGPTRVDTALALASREELFRRDAPAVVVAAHAWPDAVTGSALGARTGAPVLLTPPEGHPRLAAWLRARRPPDGFVVGGAGVLPYRLQWRYSGLSR